MKKMAFLMLLLSTAPLSYALSTPSPQLGGGYSHDQSQPLPIMCLNNGPITYSGNNSGITESEIRYSLEDVKKQLDLMLEMHVDLGIFDASSKTEFAQYMQDDNLSLSLIYRTNLLFKDSNYNLPSSGEVLNHTGKQWLNDPDSFRAYCGDGYVAQMHHGAYLYVVFQMNFTREEDKKRFEEKLSGSFMGIGDFNAALKTQSSKLGVDGNIHIIAYQVGGYPQRLAQIFNSDDFNHPSTLSRCALTDITNCMSVMSGVIKYITTDFPNQVKIDDNYPVPQMAAETGVETNDYQAIIPKNGDSLLTPEIIDARDKLGQLLTEQQAYHQRAEYLKTLIHYPYIYDQTQIKLNQLSSDTAFNISLLKSTGRSCFNNVKSCLKNTNYTEEHLKKIDQNAVVLPNRFEIQELSDEGREINQQLFVDSQKGNPIYQKLRGVQTSPTISGNYDIDLSFQEAEVYLTKRDHLNHKIIAQYQGALMEEGVYAGRVNYSGSQSSVRWQGKFTHYEAKQMLLKKKSIFKH